MLQRYKQRDEHRKINGWNNAQKWQKRRGKERTGRNNRAVKLTKGKTIRMAQKGEEK
jgi:hypothetical protein